MKNTVVLTGGGGYKKITGKCISRAMIANLMAHDWSNVKLGIFARIVGYMVGNKVELHTAAFSKNIWEESYCSVTVWSLFLEMRKYRYAGYVDGDCC